MDSSNDHTARRSEDIALDLLKFVASHANLGSKSAPSTPGFGVPSSAKPEYQINQVLQLYARCREAVEAPIDAATPAAKK